MHKITTNRKYVLRPLYKTNRTSSNRLTLSRDFYCYLKLLIVERLGCFISNFSATQPVWKSGDAGLSKSDGLANIVHKSQPHWKFLWFLPHDFSQWAAGLFVDNEMSDNEKHALSTRCWLPEKQLTYMFLECRRIVIQGKTKRCFRREYMEMYNQLVIRLESPKPGSFLEILRFNSMRCALNSSASAKHFETANNAFN